MAAGLSDATGHFIIHNAPHGTNVPLVIQIGKWRRQVTLTTVTACQDNPFNDPTTFRLPKKQSEATCPQIAHLHRARRRARLLLCAGSASTIRSSPPTPAPAACTCTSGGGGHGGQRGSRPTLASGATLADSYSKLFPNFAQMSNYDIMVLTCESSQLAQPRIPTSLNMKRYADSGGKVFAEHLHSYWIRKGLPPWPATGDWATSIAPDLADPSDPP